METSRICLALDGLSLEDAVSITSRVGNRCYAAKIHDLYDAEGPNVISILKNAGMKRVWVDYKTHDTKDTVGLRVKALVRNGADIITVHASGGVSMMRAAVEAAFSKVEFSRNEDVPMEIWAVTVLTSLDDGEIHRTYGKDRTRNQIVLDFALMAREAGIKGLICSAQEVGMLSAHRDLRDMVFTVPGTRSAGVALGQQKRSGTPKQALTAGATYLVAGSQVTKSVDPVAAFDTFAAEIA